MPSKEAKANFISQITKEVLSAEPCLSLIDGLWEENEYSFYHPPIESGLHKLSGDAYWDRAFTFLWMVLCAEGEE